MSRFQKNIGQAGCQTLNTKSFFMERDDQELSMDKKGIKCDLWLKKKRSKKPVDDHIDCKMLLTLRRMLIYQTTLLSLSKLVFHPQKYHKR